ncbi:MAG: DivIVA domain-containing protein [Propionibacteriaceae bacterium]|nr:DivIVA domain-containing protein [Propionibacteriaceae bacterium]
MVWVTVVVAIAMLGAAAWAGTGRFGEMPEPVSGRPKPHIPEGPVDEAFLEALTLPVASTGYRRSQVDARLAAHVAHEPVDADARFDVVRRGYDMQAVDAVLDRLLATPDAPLAERSEDAGGDVVYEVSEPAPTLVDSAEPPQDPVSQHQESTPVEDPQEAARGDLPAS